MRRVSIRFAFAVLALPFLAACSKNESEQAKPAATAPPATAIASAAPSAARVPAADSAPAPSAKAAPHVELYVASVANTMTFDKAKLTAPAGAEVHLTLKNNATMATLPHNWVLVKAGTEAAVAAAGLKMGEQAGYIDVRDHDMLANTPQAKPGETVEVTFTAPDQPGDYPYICTTPGHYLMMKGVLTITPGA